MKTKRLTMLPLLLALLILCTQCALVPASPALPENPDFAIHFIDVGQADAALVLCEGEAMLIDGGNNEDASLMYSYLREQGVNRLDAVVCTHAHEDHAGGLTGALNFATAETAYAPHASDDNKYFRNFLDKLDEQGTTLTIPEPGDSFSLGSATVTVLGPVEESDNENDMSIVLRIVYGDTSFLFTGDAEFDEEHSIIERGFELESTLLKVGHHGSAGSSSYVFLREVMPEYAVISVGADNSYGHPTEEALSRLRDVGAELYRTDECGTVICESDGKDLSFTTEREREDTPVVSTPAGARDYVLNTNTMKYHLPDCGSVTAMNEANRADFTGTPDELAALGYSPCGSCRPDEN